MGLTYPNGKINAVVKTSFLHRNCMEARTVKSQQLQSSPVFQKGDYQLCMPIQTTEIDTATSV